MREIKKLADEMQEELHGACKYAKCYQKYKDINSMWAKKYYEMANDEIRHAEYLHDFAVDLIEKSVEDGKDAPEYMKIIWDDEHDKFIEDMAKVKMILSM